MAPPLMPKATAVWLVDNTALSFEQIAAFCELHPLEVKGIADGDVAQGIVGLNPISTGQLTREDIERCEGDANARLAVLKPAVDLSNARRKGPRFTPVSRRQEKPNAVSWLIKSHPELTDAQISRLVGTTKPTIGSIRNRTHWNIAAIKPQDPVSLGLCSQVDLDGAVQDAARRLARQKHKEEVAARRRLREQERAAAAAEETAPLNAPHAPQAEPTAGEGGSEGQTG